VSEVVAFEIRVPRAEVVETVTGRADAIARAKRLSLTHLNDKVVVRSTDDKVSMELRRGELLTFKSR